MPIAFAAAGNLEESPGGALAPVVADGYFGLFVGPPLLGTVAEAITLPWALLIVRWEATSVRASRLDQ